MSRCKWREEANRLQIIAAELKATEFFAEVLLIEDGGE